MVAFAVKSPIGFLLLVGTGTAAIVRRRNWTELSASVAALAIVIITMPVKYQVGVRHVLVLYPLLAIGAGYGCSVLWNVKRWHIGRTVLGCLLLWHGVSSLQARNDFLSYFNELAGEDPGRILTTGCDLECGQDIFRLAQLARERQIADLNIAVWSTADLARMGLPPLHVLPPHQYVSGWVAIGIRALRDGDVSLSTRGYVPGTSYPADSFAWLQKYKPVATAGRTIRLYYIP